MKKPTVYLDTSYISAFWYEGANLPMLARRFHTREWWMLERRSFSVVVSDMVETELNCGVYSRKKNCVRMVRRIRHLASPSSIRKFIDALIGHCVVPVDKPMDAAHLAIAALCHVDYLLNWNYAHMANPVVQEKFDQLCHQWDIRPSMLVSPESIPQVRFGQDIRRGKR